VKQHVVVIGSGAGGGAAAWVLAQAGFQVTVLEKGRNFFRGLGDPRALGLPLFGGDEIRKARGFPGSDTFAEPRSLRSQREATEGVERSHVGDVNHLPFTVGGGTTHWDAKTPRFWKADFEMRSRYGPIEGADVVDWPFGYETSRPWIEQVEEQLGVAGSLEETPDFVLVESPRGPYPLPPGPPQYASLLFAEAAGQLGYRAHPFPMAINSRPYDGRPTCRNCGYCSGFGCPINARAGSAVTFLRRALLSDARLVTRAVVTRIGCDDRGLATHVEYLDAARGMKPVKLSADAVVLAASPIESARLALLSRSPAHPHGLGNREEGGRVGRTLCFHTSTFAAGVMPQRLHAHRGRSTTHCLLEPCVPDTGSRWARWAGLPYLRGGVVELGGAPNLIEEARIYDDLPFTPRTRHKDMMRESSLRDRLLAAQMLGEDLPQYENRVDLDPRVRDVYGLPVARVTYSHHKHDLLASWVWGRRIQKICKAAGAGDSYFYPAGLGFHAASAHDTRHIGCTMRMGRDPAVSVCDEFGRIHGAPNVVVCDGSVLPSFGAVNPTLTVMAVALRSATALAHGEGQARRGPLARIMHEGP